MLETYENKYISFGYKAVTTIFLISFTKLSARIGN